jgi:hypothetical protein
MGLASYEVIESGSSWGVLHDGNVEGTFETKEAAFERRFPPHHLPFDRGMRFV